MRSIKGEPTARELLEAVLALLRNEVRPKLKESDPENAFAVRIAETILATLARETGSEDKVAAIESAAYGAFTGPPVVNTTSAAQMAEFIRSNPDIAHNRAAQHACLKAACARLGIDNPKYASYSDAQEVLARSA